MHRQGCGFLDPRTQTTSNLVYQILHIKVQSTLPSLFIRQNPQGSQPIASSPNETLSVDSKSPVKSLNKNQMYLVREPTCPDGTKGFDKKNLQKDSNN
jgi:hypothetical protein